MRSSNRKMTVEPYEIDWKNSALHNDYRVMKEVLTGIIRMALQDWNAMKNKTEFKVGAYNTIVYKDELKSFFNSTWFGDILSVLYPQFDQESACIEIAKQRYSMKDVIDPSRNQRGSKKKKP